MTEYFLLISVYLHHNGMSHLKLCLRCKWYFTQPCVKASSDGINFFIVVYMCYCNIHLLYSLIRVIPRRLNFICRRFGTLSVPYSSVVWTGRILVHTTYEDGTDRVLRNVDNWKFRRRGNHPKERINDSQRGESLESRIIMTCTLW